MKLCSNGRTLRRMCLIYPQINVLDHKFQKQSRRVRIVGQLKSGRSEFNPEEYAAGSSARFSFIPSRWQACRSIDGHFGQVKALVTDKRPQFYFLYYWTCGGGPKM